MGAKGLPKTPGSGRKKNTCNKDSIPLKEKAEELGIDPFEILLFFAAGRWKQLGYASETYTRFGANNVMNEEFTIEPAVRARAASEACQYLHPKLKAIEHSGLKGGPIQTQEMSDEALASRASALLSKLK